MLRTAAALNSYRPLAAGYDASCRHIERIRQDAVDSLRLRPGETVFDIACGTGSTILPMAESVGPSGHVVGVELVPEMAAIARAKLVAVGLMIVSQCMFLQRRISRLTYAPMPCCSATPTTFCNHRKLSRIY